MLPRMEVWISSNHTGVIGQVPGVCLDATANFPQKCMSQSHFNVRWTPILSRQLPFGRRHTVALSILTIVYIVCKLRHGGGPEPWQALPLYRPAPIDLFF